MIAITSVNGFHLPFEERFEKIKETGFDGVMLWWGGDDGIPRFRKAGIVRGLGLDIVNVHSTTEGVNSLWTDGHEGDEKLDDLTSQLYDCGECGINTMIVHLSKGKTPPPVSSAGLSRLEKLIERAESAKVRLAFENMRYSEYTVRVLNEFDSPYVGLCWDSGHEHCWSGDVDWLKLYHDRVFAIHLHDNKGDGDSHMIPFDGTIHWENKLNDIAVSSYRGYIPIEAEFASSGLYDSDGFERFLAQAYDRGTILNMMLKKKREKTVI